MSIPICDQPKTMSEKLFFNVAFATMPDPICNSVNGIFTSKLECKIAGGSFVNDVKEPCDKPDFLQSYEHV